MTAVEARPRSRGRFLLPLLIVVAAALAGLAGALVIARQTESRREAVARRGALVMPFDLARTTHVFTDTAEGGREVVSANDPNDAEQIALIRSHLRGEAAKFSGGDFSDPAAIHGETMPGLQALREGAARVSFSCDELPDGAAITYRTTDPGLIAALHAWFAAQRHDHGAHQMRH